MLGNVIYCIYDRIYHEIFIWRFNKSLCIKLGILYLDLEGWPDPLSRSNFYTFRDLLLSLDYNSCSCGPFLFSFVNIVNSQREASQQIHYTTTRGRLNFLQWPPGLSARRSPISLTLRSRLGSTPSTPSWRTAMESSGLVLITFHNQTLSSLLSRLWAHPRLPGHDTEVESWKD